MYPILTRRSVPLLVKKARKMRMIIMVIGQLGMTLANAAVGGAVGMGMNRINQKNQLKQQGKLNEQQIKGAKQMSDIEKNNQMDMWNKTNYKAQVGHMKEAGLNPALMYGMGGGGGTTTGGGGGGMPTGGQADSGATQSRGMLDIAMLAAQTKVLESQAEKNQAETQNTKVNTEKTAGVDTTATTTSTAETAERTRGTKFDNDVKQMVGVGEFASAEGGKQRALQETSRKERYAAEAWTRVMSETESGEQVGADSPESRLYKSLVTEYQKAKSEGNLLKAEETIKRWSTELINDGMPPDSPWYYKLIERFINNASGGKINLKDIGKEVGKKVIKAGM